MTDDPTTVEFTRNGERHRVRYVTTADPPRREEYVHADGWGWRLVGTETVEQVRITSP